MRRSSKPQTSVGHQAAHASFYDSLVHSQRRWQVVLIAALLAALTVAAYCHLWLNDFVIFDDLKYIVLNPHVNTGLSWDNVRWAFTRYYADNWHPLTWISHMLDVQLFGMRAGGHHLVNLTLHIVNAILLFYFFMYTTSRLWPSFWVAGLFALHPLHVESVAWASERKDTLSTLFWLATMLAYAGYVKKHGTWRYLSVVVLMALGLMAKPMLVTLPFVLLLLDYWPLQRFVLAGWRPIPETGQSLEHILAEKVPLAILAACTAVVTMMVQKPAASDVVPFVVRILNAIISYVRYLWMMVWPANLSILYYFFHTPRLWTAAAAFLVLVAITIIAFAMGRYRRYVLVGWLWYLGTLVPVIGLVHVGYQSHADRYTYIPLIGIFVLIAYGIGDAALARPAVKKLIAVGGIALLAALCAVTYRTAAYWRNDATLLGRAIEVMPENAIMRSALGGSLINQGRFEEARRELLASAAIRQTADTMHLLGKAARGLGQFDEALRCYAKAIEWDPGLVKVYIDAGTLLYELQRYQEARDYLRQAIDLDPEAAAAYRILAAILANEKDYAGAAEQYEKSLAIEQDFSAWNNLGDAQLQMRQVQEAERSFRRALVLEPGSAVAHDNLAMALAGLGDKTQAVAEAAVAVNLDPNYVKARDYYHQLTGK